MLFSSNRRRTKNVIRHELRVLDSCLVLGLLALLANTGYVTSFSNQTLTFNVAHDLTPTSGDTAGSDGTVVHVSISAMYANNQRVEYSINSLENITKFHSEMTKLFTDFRLHIRQQEVTLFILELRSNSLVIARNFTQRFYSQSGEQMVERAEDMEHLKPHCYYIGHVLGNRSSLASFDLCDGVSGVVMTSQRSFTFRPIIEGDKVWHKLTNETVDRRQQEQQRQCGHNNTNQSVNSMDELLRSRRSLQLPISQNGSTKYIEMYVVMDYNLYRRTGTVDETVKRAINIVNFANTLFQQLDIYLALVGVEVWNDRNKISYARYGSSEYDSNEVLIEFCKYRLYNINKHTLNDNAQLFVDVDLDANVIGRAFSATICTRTLSAGVTWDGNSVEFNRAGVTMAHELGHNLGFLHTDEHHSSERGRPTRCACRSADGRTDTCVMHGIIDFPPATQWSTCTYEERHAYDEQNLYVCMDNIPKAFSQSEGESLCGNYVIDGGEDCDCGLPLNCMSKCCDASTCRLLDGAACATGTCCNLNTCSIRGFSEVCRPLQDSECDLEEFCDGSTEWCPSDSYKRDGTDCFNRSEAYCYSGKCNSHDSQCHFIWGVESIINGNESCYSYFNNNSDYSGNCGWAPQQLDRGDGRLEKDFQVCRKEDDKLCGLLHCHYKKFDIVNRVQILRIYNYQLDGIVYNTYGDLPCAVTSFDVGDSEYDPGQVPNGAKCGDERICIDTICTPVSELHAPCECSGRGVCNQNNECQCDDGWSPPFCRRRGKSRRNAGTGRVSLGLLALLLALFLGLIPMLCTILLFLYRRRRAVKEKVQIAKETIRKKPKPKADPPEQRKPPRTKPKSDAEKYGRGMAFNQNLDIPGFAPATKLPMKPFKKGSQQSNTSQTSKTQQALRRQPSNTSSTQPQLPNTQPSNTSSTQPQVPKAEPSNTSSAQSQVPKAQPSNTSSAQPQVPKAQPSSTPSTQPQIAKAQPSNASSTQPSKTQQTQPRKPQVKPPPKPQTNVSRPQAPKSQMSKKPTPQPPSQAIRKK